MDRCQMAEFKPEKQVKRNRAPRINLPNRGGKINIVCEEHRNEKNCFCDYDKTQAMPMIMCDTCMIWYHNKCEGLTGL